MMEYRAVALSREAWTVVRQIEGVEYRGPVFHDIEIWLGFNNSIFRSGKWAAEQYADWSNQQGLRHLFGYPPETHDAGHGDQSELG